MSRFIKFVLLICLILNVVFVANAAEAFETNVVVDGYNAQISGTADAYEGTEVAIVVVRPGKDINSIVKDSEANADTLLNNNVLCITQVLTDSEKNFNYTCKFGSNEKSGTYTLRVQVYAEPQVREKKFIFQNEARKALGISGLQTTNLNNLKTVLKEYATDIDVLSGEQYATFTTKEKDYVAYEILSASSDKAQRYIAAVSEIKAVRDMKNLTKENLKAYINGGSVVGVSSSEISDYSRLTSFKKDLFVADFYKAIRNKETPSEIKTAFSDVMKDVKNNDSGSSGGGLGGSSSGSVGVTGGASSTTNNPYVIETPANEGFLDMGNAQWAKVAVDTLFERGIIKGRSATQFCPNDIVTREEFLKMVIESLNIVGISEDKKNFTDVNSGAWYAHYVETGLGTGVINGISESEFGVGLPIKREDMATILYRAVKYGEVSLYSTVEVEFKDNASISEYAIEAVNALSSAKVINGMDDGSFMPKKTATRAEAAMMLYNLLYR